MLKQGFEMRHFDFSSHTLKLLFYLKKIFFWITLKDTSHVLKEHEFGTHEKENRE